MRTAAVVLLLLLAAPLAAETPRQSFEAFVAAVLDRTGTRESRNAVFERYFDFETWLARREAETGTPHTDAEKAELKQGWLDLFASEDFRKRYEASGVKVIDAPAPQGDAAELRIAVGEQRFRVLMKAALEGSYWRWYDIPAVEAAASPAERLAEIERTLAQIKAELERLQAAEAALREEAAKLRAQRAEKDAGASDYASPRSVVAAAWRAVESGDVNALLDCHTAARVAEAEPPTVKAAMEATLKRLMSWEITDSVINEQDSDRAVVSVRLKFQRTGESDERVISVNVVRRGGQWKIDEAP